MVSLFRRFLLSCLIIWCIWHAWSAKNKEMAKQCLLIRTRIHPHPRSPFSLSIRILSPLYLQLILWDSCSCRDVVVSFLSYGDIREDCEMSIHPKIPDNFTKKGDFWGTKMMRNGGDASCHGWDFMKVLERVDQETRSSLSGRRTWNKSWCERRDSS
jgi:hypothetical protein